MEKLADEMFAGSFHGEKMGILTILSDQYLVWNSCEFFVTKVEICTKLVPPTKYVFTISSFPIQVS